MVSLMYSPAILQRRQVGLIDAGCGPSVSHACQDHLAAQGVGGSGRRGVLTPVRREVESRAAFPAKVRQGAEEL